VVYPALERDTLFIHAASRGAFFVPLPDLAGKNPGKIAKPTGFGR
jgi:hypothetical protein